MMKFAVLVFPGSNCDVDMYRAVEDCLQQPVEYVFYTEAKLDGFDGILLPGGFPTAITCVRERSLALRR